MATMVACPSCQSRYNVPDTVLGKRVKCPRCQETFPVPAAPTDTEALVTDLATTRPPIAPAGKPKADPDDDFDRPRRRRTDPDDDLDDERPRRRREDDDDDWDEPRPRRKKKKAASSSNGVLLGVLGGVGLVMLLVCGGVAWKVYSVYAAARRGVQAVVARVEEQQRVNQLNVNIAAPNNGIPVVLDAGGRYSNDNFLSRLDPQVEGKFCKTYAVPFEKGKSYQLDMMSGQFDTYLRVLNPHGQQVAFDDDGGEGLNARVILTAQETGTYKVLATSFNFAIEGNNQGGYTLRIGPFQGAPPPFVAPGPGGGRRLAVGGNATAVALGPDGVFQHASNLAPADPRVNNKAYKLYTLPVQQGQMFQIDQTSAQMDSYLYVLNARDEIVTQDDDSGGNLNSRIVFTAPDTGTYKIVSTSLGGRQFGGFQLTVRRLGP